MRWLKSLARKNYFIGFIHIEMHFPLPCPQFHLFKVPFNSSAVIFTSFTVEKRETASRHSQCYQLGHLYILKRTGALVLSLEVPLQIVMPIANFFHSVQRANFDFPNSSE